MYGDYSVPDGDVAAALIQAIRFGYWDEVQALVLGGKQGQIESIKKRSFEPTFRTHNCHKNGYGCSHRWISRSTRRLAKQ